MTLDSLIADHGIPAFCKIDVEGFELQALEGLSQPLPALSFEYLPAAIGEAIRCLDRLSIVGEYEYNVSIPRDHAPPICRLDRPNCHGILALRTRPDGIFRRRLCAAWWGNLSRWGGAGMLMRRQGLDELGRSRHNGIEAYLGRLFGYACSLNHDRTAAQELVQECIVKALAARRVPGDEAAYRAWLFRILRNCYLDGLRRRSSRANGLEWAAADEGEIWSADRLIDVLAVKEGLRKLPGAMREIIAFDRHRRPELRRECGRARHSGRHGHEPAQPGARKLAADRL